MIETRWRIELLGGLRVAGGGRVVTQFRTQKTGALLAYLACHLRDTHPREVLMALFWPEDEPHAARHSLSQALSWLRHLLEPDGVPPRSVLVADRTTVRLNPDAVTTDVAAFHTALQAAALEQSSHSRAQLVTQAVDGYGGRLLPGYYEDWIVREQERLAELYLKALGELTRLLEESGDLHAAIGIAHRAVAADPLREKARRDLMRLFTALGQPDVALREYRELVRLLKEELDTGPAAATRSLAQQILRRVTEERNEASSPRGAPIPGAPPAQTAAPATPVETPSLDPLPSPLTRFFGREEDCARLADLARVGGARLVTLTGPGGSGKTRLAIEMARRVAASFGAAWFVSLVDVTEPTLIEDRVREALRLPRSPEVEPLEQVIVALSRQPALLVLDNFEQLVEGGASLVSTLLDRVPTLCCWITSRQRLQLPGEREVHVLPLPVPAEGEPPERIVGFASVQLFVDRAQSVRGEFQVTAATAAEIAALVRRMEGIPLALELAAARAQVLTPAQMLMRLEQRFTLLVNRQRGAEPRHRSLWASLDWSYELLSSELQRFFARLSVFRGGWTLETAEAVCDEPLALEYTEVLRECSMLLAEERSGEMRFRMLETLREYGHERLVASGELDITRRRHAEYYMVLAETTYSKLLGPDQAIWYNRLEVEHDNIRAVLEWAVASGQAQIGLRLAGALGLFWSLRGHWVEARQQLARLLALPGAAARTSARARALNGAGCMARNQGAYADARPFHEESLSIARELGDRPGIADALNHLANAFARQGDYEAARALYEEHQAVAREIGDQRGVANSLANLGSIAYKQGEDETARALWEQSEVIFRELGDLRGIAHSINALGQIAHRQGDFVKARLLYEESLLIYRELGHKSSIAQTLQNLGRVALCQTDTRAARTCYAESLPIVQELGRQQEIPTVLEGLAEVASAEGNPERAARLLGAAAALRERIGAPPPPAERSDSERTMAVTSTALGEEAFAALWGEGRALSLGDAVAYALTDRDAPSDETEWLR